MQLHYVEKSNRVEQELTETIKGKLHNRVTVFVVAEISQKIFQVERHIFNALPVNDLWREDVSSSTLFIEAAEYAFSCLPP